MPINKLDKDGMVAVIYSPGHGAGWSTWGGGDADPKELIFDAGLAQMILDGKHESEITRYADEKWPDVYKGGLQSVKIKWLPKGTIFRIEEYDGSESIEIFNVESYHEA